MQLLDIYLQAKQEIYAYFGYEPEWKVYPLYDNRQYFWALNGKSEVVFAENKENILWHDEACEYVYPDGCEDFYSESIIGEKIYVGKDYTMICMDTLTDGNKFLSIFTNSKQITEAPLFNEYIDGDGDEKTW